MVKKMIKYLAFKEKRKLTYLKGAKSLPPQKTGATISRRLPNPRQVFLAHRATT
jgi:hypothetical protein